MPGCLCGRRCECVKPPRCGLALGPLCCALAALLLARNEYVVVQHNRLVDLGERAVVEADCNTRDAQCVGCLVHLRGCAVAPGSALQRFAPGVDPSAVGPPPPTPPAGLWATAEALRLSTEVEYWAWEETVSVGGTYSYDEVWTAAPQTSWENPCATQDCQGSARYAPGAKSGSTNETNYEIKHMLAENAKIRSDYSIGDDLPPLYASAATLGSAWPLSPAMIDILLAHGGKNRRGPRRFHCVLGLSVSVNSYSALRLHGMMRWIGLSQRHRVSHCKQVMPRTSAAPTHTYEAATPTSMARTASIVAWRR